MNTHNITVAGGKSVRLLTAGKYCDRDIIVTAEGGSEDLNAVLTEQEALIATLQETLRGKASGGGIANPVIQPLEITENGIYTAPDGVDGYSPVVVEVPVPDGYIVPSGNLEITDNGSYDVTEYRSVSVDVESSGIEVETYTGTIIREGGSATGAIVHYTDNTFIVRSELVPVQEWMAPAEPLTITVVANTIVFISADSDAVPEGSGFEVLISDKTSKSVALRLVADNFAITL